jgi:hypothetical protein
MQIYLFSLEWRCSLILFVQDNKIYVYIYSLLYVYACMFMSIYVTLSLFSGNAVVRAVLHYLTQPDAKRFHLMVNQWLPIQFYNEPIKPRRALMWRHILLFHKENDFIGY